MEPKMVRNEAVGARPNRYNPDPAAALLLDFLAWIASKQRSYAEVMEIWRTSCPRLTIWEDAVDGRYVVRQSNGTSEIIIAISPLGRSLLERAGRMSSSAA
jgi:hypothetical protein